MREENFAVFSRRGVLKLAAGAGATALSPLILFGSSDFWNKKEPGEWSSEEIQQLTTRSPWAREVTAGNSDRGESGGRMGSPGAGRSGGGGMGGGRGGGMGGPGMGGPGMGGPDMGPNSGGSRYPGGGRSTQAQRFTGTVRWESAKPLLEAVKTPLPEPFAAHYVIGVGGFPLSGSRRGSQTDEDSDSSRSSEDTLDRLKGLTSLETKGKATVQAGVVQQQARGGSDILFGFSKETLTLTRDDKEVTFLTTLGNLTVKAKFNLKDMMYHGELAV